MRPSRLIRTIIRIFLLVLTVSMSLISFLGGLSAIIILSDSDNVVIPDGDIYYTLNVSEPENFLLKLPYKIDNVGYFDLEDIRIDLTIYLKYPDSRNPNNETERVTICDTHKNLDNIEQGEEGEGNFSLDSNDFKDVDYNDIITYLDRYSPSPQILYTADISLAAKYSLGLLAFRIEMYDLDIGDQELLP